MCVVEHDGSIRCHLRDVIGNAAARSLRQGGPRDAAGGRLARRPAVLGVRLGPREHHLHRDEQDQRYRHQRGHLHGEETGMSFRRTASG